VETNYYCPRYCKSKHHTFSCIHVTRLLHSPNGNISIIFQCILRGLYPRGTLSTIGYFPHVYVPFGPPLWSSGQSSWLQIWRPGFDSRHYEKKVVCLERGPLSLVSTTEELLDRKVAASVQKTENTAVGIRYADHLAPSIRKSWQSLRRQAVVARSV
jgi:hypothetical protein